MRMSKRSTKDPLLRLFLDRYHVHLLAVPREGIDVGDTYVERDGAISAPGRISQILTPTFELPSVTRGERLADIAGNATSLIEVGVALHILDNLLAGFGIPLGLSPHGALDRAGSVSFRFHEVHRDSVDVLEVGGMLPDYKLNRDNAALTAKSRIYVTTAALFTASISLELEHHAGVNVANALDSAFGSAEVSVKAEGESRVTLHARQRLGFAVELHELAFSGEDGRPAWKRVAVPVRVRGTTVVRERVAPAMIGGQHDDIFLRIS